ncbi:MAG: adenylosuccinate synthase, partial [Thermoleophilaceae bacterium]
LEQDAVAAPACFVETLPDARHERQHARGDLQQRPPQRGAVDLRRAEGVAVGPDSLRIAETAPLILPRHGELDRARERARAASNAGFGRIGTTGRGIGPAYEDKTARRAIRLGDLAEPQALSQRVQALLFHHNTLRRGLGEPEIDADAVLATLAEVTPKILPYAGVVWQELDAARRRGKRILYEGAQGTMLDVDHGTYPFVTSSNTVAGAACAGAGVGPRSIDEVWGIAKAYATRVGAGPFPTELDDALGERIRQAGGEFGTTTGRARRTGWLDLVALRYATRINGLTGLVLTKLDVLTGIDPIQVGVRYLGPEGATFDDFPYHQTIVHRVEGDLVELPGWDEDITGARSIDELPANAQAYLEFVSEFLGIPIVMVGVGPGREEMIWTGAAERLRPAAA